MNAPTVSYKVAKRFQELRRRYLAVRIGITVAVSLTALMLLWMLLAGFDYLWELSISWRKAGLLLAAAAVLIGLGQRLFVLGRDTRQRRFAARLEHSFEEFGQRIRTVLDTVDGRVSGPEEMLAALGHQTLGRWETLSPSQLIPTRTLTALAAACLLAILAAAGMFISGGDIRTAMLRALGQEIPYTELTVTPGDARLLEGAPVEVSLELAGRTNRDVMLRYRYLAEAEDTATEEAATGDEWTESELLPTEPGADEPASDRRARFAAALGKADDPIEYQFVTSVGATRVYRVDVQPLIRAERIETSVTPPAYTRLENRAFTTTRVTVLEQSKVSVTIETNHPLRGAELAIGGKPSKLEPIPIPLPSDPKQWTFELPSTQSLHWRFTGAGNDGTPMTPVKGRLAVRRDGAPRVTWRDPPDEIRVHTLAELPMRVQVSDDYGISETAIVFQLGDDDEYVLQDWIAEDPETATTNTTGKKLEKILPLESFALSERDYVSYYAYAVDNRAGNLQRSESDVRYIDIRPLRQFYAEIELDPNNNPGGRILVQLDEIIRRQRFLINRTRRLLRSSSTDLASQLGTIDNMVENQSELASLTRYLAEFFVSQGNDDVEALSQAEVAMLQAADSLAAGSFDLALVQEEDAQRALAEARRTLEIFLLKNPTLRQQQAMRRFARQLQQRLRRERPKTEIQLVDTLQKIASQQMQLGQRAQRIRRSQNMPAGSGGRGGKSDPDNQQQQGSAGAANSEATSTPQPSTESAAATTAGDPQNQDGEPGQDATTQSDPAETPESASSDEPAESGEPAEKDGGQDENGQNSDGENEMDGSGSSEEEPSLAEQQQELYAQQTELLQRVQAVAEELAERLASSPLMSERMEQATAAMDDLATQARNGELQEFAAGSPEAADQLREIGVQLDALAASEPVSRVSAIRDMTTSLANMESQLAKQQDQMNQQGQASQQGQAGETDQPGRGGRSDAGEADAMAARLARQLERRTETIEDILSAPVDIGDVETSEVNDNLESFVEETEFLQQLQSTRDAAEKIAANEPGSEGESEDAEAGNAEAADAEADDENAESEAAMARATEYVEAARMLDELYRQLVTPRLARLQRIERQATNMAQQMGGGGKAEEDDPEAKAGIRMLQKDLEEEGLAELARLLSESEMPREELKAELEQRFGTSGQSTVGFDLARNNLTGVRLRLVSAELQARIQEMILLEISADRDAPVPAEYRRAVDRYFQTLAGNAEPTDATIATPATGPPVNNPPEMNAPVMSDGGRQ